MDLIQIFRKHSLDKLQGLHKKVFLLISILLIFTFINNLKSQDWELSHNLVGSDINPKLSQLDQYNNLYVLGEFTTSIILDGTTYNSRGNRDIFLLKIDNTGQITWLKTLGNSAVDNASGISIDDTGNVYITGYFNGTCYFSTTQTLTSTGGNDFFLAKYNPSGTLNWYKNIGKASTGVTTNQRSSFLAIDNNQDIIITGHYVNQLILGGNITDTLIGSASYTYLFYAKLTINGDVIWAKNIKSNNLLNTQFSSIAINSNSYYLGGKYIDSIYFDIDSLKSNGSFNDNFLYKINQNGEGLWLRKMIGSNTEDLRRIRVDSYSNVFVMGNFISNTLIVDADSVNTVFRNKSGTGSDTYLAKYNRSGILQWLNIKGGNSTDLYNDFALMGDIMYSGGYFNDSIIFNNDTLSTIGITESDGFLASFNNIGDAISGIGIHGNLTDATNTVSCDSNLKAYITGYFRSDSIVIGDSIYKRIGNQNMFFARYSHPFKSAITDEENVSCNGGADGMLTVTPYFGVPPYTYLWSHNPSLNDSVATGLTAGSYSVQITDERDSVAIAYATVSEPAILSLSFLVTEPTCYNHNDGAADLTVTGGTPSYNYSWTGGTGINPSSEDQSGLYSGWVYVTVTDTNGCIENDSVFIDQPYKITFGNSIVTASSGANDGSIDLVINGGTGTMNDFSYSWTGPSSFTSTDDSISGLAGGNYNLTVQDLNTCEEDTSFIISDLSSFIAYINSSTNVTCRGDADGSATVTVESGTGPYSYEWTNSIGTVLSSVSSVSGLSGGWYFVEIADYNGGSWLFITDSILIVEASQSIQINKFVANPTCFGDNDGFVDVNVSGGIPNYTYLWSNGATTQDITGLSYTSDTLNVTVTDAHGCSAENWAYIVNPPELIADITLVQAVQCQGSLTGRLFANVSGGNTPYSFQWNDPGAQTDQLATELGDGMYTITVTDNTGCTDNDSYNLPDAGLLSLDSIIGYDAACYGQATGAIKANVSGASGNYSYVWGHTGINSDTLTNQSAGIYSLTVNDATCSETDNGNVTVGQPDTITISSVDTTHVNCFGDNTGSISVLLTGGSGSYNYVWGHSPENSSTVNSLPAGNYSVTVNDANCTDNEYDEILIHQAPVLQIIDIDSTDLSCNGDNTGSIVVTPSGGSNNVNYRFVWSHNGSLNDSTANALFAGNYTVTVYDDACNDNVSDLIIINEPAALSISGIDSTDVTCNGDNTGSIVVTPSGGSNNVNYRFVWSHNGSLDDSTANALFAGNYTVTVYDDVCNDNVSDLIIIDEPAALSISGIDSTDATCNGDNTGSIVVTPSGGSNNVNYRFVWSHNGSLDDSTANALFAGNYTVTVYDDACNDNVSDLIIIDEPATLSISGIDSTDVTCSGDNTGSIVVTPSGGSNNVNYRFVWSHNGSLDDSTANALSAGNYTVTVYDDACSDNISRLVNIAQPEAIQIDSVVKYPVVNQNDGEILIYASGGTGSLLFALNGSIFTNNFNFSDLDLGNYTIEVTDENECGPISDIIEITTSITNIDFQNINIYPNPAKDFITIELDHLSIRDNKVRILNSLGQQVWNGELKAGDRKLVIELNHITHGVYYLMINDKKIVQPIVIQNK